MQLLVPATKTIRLEFKIYYLLEIFLRYFSYFRVFIFDFLILTLNRVKQSNFNLICIRLGYYL
jgi:hypothetical protein